MKRSFLSYLGTSKNSAKDLANRTVFAEFPFMGKLWFIYIYLYLIEFLKNIIYILLFILIRIQKN